VLKTRLLLRRCGNWLIKSCAPQITQIGTDFIFYALALFLKYWQMVVKYFLFSFI